MAEVSLRNVVKRFDNVEAVRSINLDIPDNEFVVLVGPSGCGKSTTLRMIAGLEEVTAGDIYIGGEIVNDRPPKDRDIAMVFQNYALYPHMTAYENMSFGLKLRKFSKDEIRRRVDNAARILDIAELLDRKPSRPFSSTDNAFRGRFHWLAGDEFHALPSRAERRRTARAHFR